jgi:hypothetical protein
MRRAAAALLLVLAVTLAVAGYLSVRGLDLFGGPARAGVQMVPAGHQEIAWISPAASGDSWERLVAAVRRLQEHWPQFHPDLPRLRADLDHVFKDRTTDVPELALWLDGGEDAKLWIRWYKTSSENDDAAWVGMLAGRDRPPLAVLGGETSDRALSLARALQAVRGKWHGPDPLFFMTTATADRFAPEGAPTNVPLTPDAPRLMHVYKGRSFRFAFTNSRMASVVMAFVKDHPKVWGHSPAYVAATVGAALAPGRLESVALFAARDQLLPVSLYELAWADDPYSKDLADRFSELFREAFDGPAVQEAVAYGVGDRERPNPAEAVVLGHFLEANPLLDGNRQLLVLPTGTDQARRVLRTIARRAPLAMPNLVVLSGDSITFNNVYRDRDASWNIQDLPVPLIFFSHRNPIDHSAGFLPRPEADDPSAPTGTQDLLLFRDVVEAVVQAASHTPGTLGDADQLQRRLRQVRWWKGRINLGGDGTSFFDADGDRSAGTGEHVIWLQPRRKDGQVLAQAVIEVWRRGVSVRGRPTWQMAGRPAAPLEVQYDWPSRSGDADATGNGP